MSVHWIRKVAPTKGTWNKTYLLLIMKFLLSRINTISCLRVTPQGNGLFKWEVLKFVKSLRKKSSAKIQMAQQAVPSLVFYESHSWKTPFILNRRQDLNTCYRSQFNEFWKLDFENGRRSNLCRQSSHIIFIQHFFQHQLIVYNHGHLIKWTLQIQFIWIKQIIHPHPILSHFPSAVVGSLDHNQALVDIILGILQVLAKKFK